MQCQRPDCVGCTVSAILARSGLTSAMNWKSAPTVLAAIVASALVSACNAQLPSPDWNGSWKLNPSKSSFRGPILTISISADGEYRYDDGSLTFAFRCDGKDRPTTKDRTRACVKSTTTVLDLTQKENGVKTSVSHWELSADGNVFKATKTVFRADGPVVLGQLVASRVSGSNDFDGQWRDTSFLQRHSDMTLRLEAQTLHINYPNAEQHIDAPLNGVDVAVGGAHAPEGTTYTPRVAGSREIDYLTKHNGTVVEQGSLKLSSDGRAVVDSWWNPDRPNDKGSLVYEKQ
jgi:hypothetical protein